MFFSRIYDRKLAQASYLVGCQATGEAVVIDPNRDVAQYCAAAAAEGLRITHVTETHIHADFLSGARELAQQTGAALLLSGEGGTDWQYAYAAASNARLVRGGGTFTVGRLRFDVLHTPGHTPEHVSFLLTDVPASHHPLMFFSGDFVFVGDVGRPDLLEKAAKVGNTMETAARELWRSLARFRDLPDHVQVWPGHGAGSACGKALGAVPTSTVGYEKLANWGVSTTSEAVFVQSVLEGQPEPPAYFARMKRENRAGPALVGDAPALRHLSDAEFAARRGEGSIVVDLRAAARFAQGHLRGAINIPLNRSFTTYAGSAVAYDHPMVFVAPDEAGGAIPEAARDFRLIGLDMMDGFVAPSALVRTGSLATCERVSPSDAVARHARGMLLLDVRGGTERAELYVPGTTHIPFPDLATRAGELRRDQPLLVQCQGGSRSAIAASMLRALGLDANDAGGIEAWQMAGGPVQTGQ